MGKNILYTIFLQVLCFNLFGQVNDASIRQLVLSNNVKDSLYIFGKWHEKGGTETHLRYLGIIKTKGRNYKIITSSWFWGISKRATNRILVFNEENNYIGNYYVGGPDELPEKIENNQVVFLNSNNDCDKTIITRLSFKNGIPNEFFLECKDGFGDVFSFEKE